MLEEFSLNTDREGCYEITALVRGVVRRSGVREGLCVVWCPHTTAAVTINENSDPDVLRDLMLGLAHAYPDRPEFSHDEGNSAANLKAAALGASQTLIIHDGDLMLGRWQGVFFCEFDGPRNRRWLARVVAAGC